MKAIIMAIIITLSVLLHSVYAIDEYTRIEGKVLGIDEKSSAVLVKVYSKVCRGTHTFDIENTEAIKSFKVGDDISLYVINNCNKAKIGEHR
jgi:ribosomal protein S1